MARRCWITAVAVILRCAARRIASDKSAVRGEMVGRFPSRFVSVFRGDNFFFFIFLYKHTWPTVIHRVYTRVCACVYFVCCVDYREIFVRKSLERVIIPTAVFPIRVDSYFFSFHHWSFRTYAISLSRWQDTVHIEGRHVRETCKYNKHYYYGKQNARPVRRAKYFRLDVFSLFFHPFPTAPGRTSTTLCFHCFFMPLLLAGRFKSNSENIPHRDGAMYVCETASCFRRTIRVEVRPLIYIHTVKNRIDQQWGNRHEVQRWTTHDLTTPFGLSTDHAEYVRNRFIKYVIFFVVFFFLSARLFFAWSIVYSILYSPWFCDRNIRVLFMIKTLFFLFEVQLDRDLW